MKRAGWITTAAVAAVAVIGGGTAYALNQTDDETPAAIETTAPVEETTEATELTPEPTETIEPSETTTPVEVTPAPDETVGGESEYVEYAGSFLRGAGLDLTDAEVLSAGEYACAELAEGAVWSDIKPIEGTTEHINGTVVKTAEAYLCD